jgi:hypothetical protein
MDIPGHCNGLSSGWTEAKGAFQRALEDISPAFKIVSKVANGSKHMILESAASTMTFSGAFSGAPFSVLPYSSGLKSFMHVKIGDASHDVPMNVDLAYRVWVDLNAENSW